jgi:uncharacterized membrane-anchored protein
VNKDWVAVALLGILGTIAIVALISAIALADANAEKTGAIGVATACVGALAALAGYLFKHRNDH